MTTPSAAVVVGAGIAGGRTCVRLRDAGFTGRISLVGAEPHLPYDRPPLSKAVLASDVDLEAETDLGLDLGGIDVVLGSTAVSVDLAARTVVFTTGRLSYDALVVATGARPVRLPGEGAQVTLRTREDARALRSALVPGARVVVVGAGWIGAEVVTAALARGCEVVCLEAGPGPLCGPLGEDVARLVRRWWGDVDLRTGVRVAEVVDAGVVLHDGTLVVADVVVSGVGVRPDTSWLADSGLVLAPGGIPVNDWMRTSDPHVYAVGDAALRHSARHGAVVPTGHWDEAANGPAVVAAAILGSGPGPDHVPYFWSDQFGRKLQYVGRHSERDAVVVRGDATADRWGVAWVAPDGRLSAHLNVGYPRAMVQARAAIADGRIVDPVALRDLTEVP